MQENNSGKQIGIIKEKYWKNERYFVTPVVEDKCSIYYLRHSKHSKSISNDERFGEIGVFHLDDSKRKVFSKEFITENYKEAID